MNRAANYIVVILLVISSFCQSDVAAKTLKFIPRGQNDVIEPDQVTSASGKLKSPANPRVIPPANPNDPVRLPKNVTRSVLVVGGGLAGLSAALELSERGYDVTIKEAGGVLGGRLASRSFTVGNQTFTIDNAFISWMKNNYQFLDVADRLNVTKQFIPWQAISYIFKSYKPETRTNLHSYPIDVIEMLWNSPNINFWEVLKTVFESGKLVNFNYDKVYQTYDELKFTDWVAQSGVPQEFADVFLSPIGDELKNNISEISAAEVMTYFYLHYLSTAQTATADRLIPHVNNREALIGPLETYLRTKTFKPVKIQLNKKMSAFNFDQTGHHVTGGVDDPVFDYCILATGADAVKEILIISKEEWSGLLPAYESLSRVLDGVKNVDTVEYAIVRVWFDKSLDANRPPVVFTSNFAVVKSIVLYHLFEKESMQWAKKTNGSVLEFHVTLLEDNLEKALPVYIQEACQALPEICKNNFTVVATTNGTYSDIPSLSVGQGRQRPNVTFAATSGINNLYLAGDWLKTDYPSAIGEKAICTGREAANQILLRDKVRQSTLVVPSSYGPGWL